MGQAKPGAANGGAGDGRTRGPCPVCKAPNDPALRPFCSRRCADLDLLRWLRGAYAIPGHDGDAAEEQAPRSRPEDAAGTGEAD